MMRLIFLFLLFFFIYMYQALAGVEDYSTTAGSNTSVGGVSIAEGMNAANVNNAMRAMMADTKTWYDAGEWIVQGTLPVWVAATQFKITGSDVTADYTVGRRVRVVSTTPGTIYGVITASSFSTDTTVTVDFDSGSLTNEAFTSVSLHVLTDDETPVGKHTIWVPAIAITSANTSGAEAGQISTTTGQNIETLDFDASSDEYGIFNIAMPKSWDASTMTYFAYWSTSATDTDGVAWGLQALASGDNEAIDGTWGTAIVVTDDAQSAAEEVLVTAESAAMTISGTPAIGDLSMFRVLRDVSDANDDMTEDAQLIGLKLIYRTRKANDN